MIFGEKIELKVLCFRHELLIIALMRAFKSRCTVKAIKYCIRKQRQ